MTNVTTQTEKSELAFRTISEAAEVVGVPQHVLRFWETRFPELQPLKRGGNRRYYRPADMELLETIRAMLHDQGLTIRGAKLILAGGTESPRGTIPTTPRSPGRRASDKAPLIDPESPILPPRFEFAKPSARTASLEHASVDKVVVTRAKLRDIRDRLRLALAA